jgi:two-component system nitrate/nitrite sensor histidine kinase NarX
MVSLAGRVRKVIEANWFPWSLAGVTLVAVLVFEILQFAWFKSLSGGEQIFFWLLILLSLGLLYLTVNRFAELYKQRDLLEKRLAASEKVVNEAYHRLQVIFDVSQRFLEASDENDIMEPVLQLLTDLSGADGASFVPLDEHGQPQAAVSKGVLPFSVMEAWVEYLASPGVRERCRSCTMLEALDKPDDCPLLKPDHSPFINSVKLLCLPVRRGESNFGMATLFLKKSEALDDLTRNYLKALIDEAALGLEGVRLRRREMAALQQIQLLRQKTDLNALLRSLLENVHRAMEADIAAMIIPSAGNNPSQIKLSQGDLPAQSWPFLDGVMQGVMASGEPVLLGDVSGGPSSLPGLRALIAAPLFASDQAVLGVILLGNRRGRSFQQRQLALLHTIAGQVALVVQNTNLIADLEYKTMMQERTRLAREIHDGLAQTLGFLKLHAAQMRGYLNRGEMERMRQAIDLCYSTLAEAYQDARQSIDGLRISPVENGLAGWLEQTVHDFQDVSGLSVDLHIHDLCSDLAPEVHAQLMRILQEALSNIRKHAQARQVRVVCAEQNGELLLDICDDGVGFSPEDISLTSRHGLRGMSERAELIGAEFQIQSRIANGATIRVRLPLRQFASVVQSDEILVETAALDGDIEP